MSAAGAILIGGLLLAAAWLVWPRRRRARHASGGDGAGRDRSAAERAESVAGALESIAMCLQAGLTPARSVEIAAERLPPDSVVAGVLLDVRRALLRGDPAEAGHFARRVRDSDFGRRFAAGTSPNLPVADLDIAADADRFAFAMPVRRERDHLVIR